MRTLETISEIKQAVDAGHDVRCSGGGYRVTCDSIGQYLITFESTGYCIGLHGAENTKYATKLNGRDFYIKDAVQGPKPGVDLSEFERLDPNCEDVPEWMTWGTNDQQYSGVLRELSDDYSDGSDCGACRTLCTYIDAAAERLDAAHLEYLTAKAKPLPLALPQREYDVERALSWASQQGYADGYAALNEYCDARGLDWVADPVYYFVTITEKESYFDCAD